MISINPSLSRGSIVIVAVLTVAFVLLSAAYFVIVRVPSKISENDTPTPRVSSISDGCLSENKTIKYIVKQRKSGGIQTEVDITVTDKIASSSISKFSIENVRDNYHPVEAHECNIYIVRLFNYDKQKTKQNPGYREELWRYDLKGNGEKVILLVEKSPEFTSYFSADFRVNPTEAYIALEAIEVAGHPFLIGVQWHPEALCLNPVWKKLFDVFISKARQARA